MKNEALNEKVIKWFYNVHGPLDEYRRNKVNQIGSNIAIFLTLFDLALAFAAGIMVLATGNYELALNAVVWGLIIVIFLIGIYVSYKTTKLHITDIEVDKQQVAPARRRVLKRSITSGIYFAIMTYLLEILINWLPEHGAIAALLLNVKTITSAVIAGIAFAGLIAFFEFKQIKQYSD